MEQRMDSFTMESTRKIDGLTQSVATSSGRLQDEVSAKLVKFKNSLEGTVKELGIHLTLYDIRADEFHAMLILEDEREKLDREQLNSHGR